jgi:hypothetical protein
MAKIMSDPEIIIQEYRKKEKIKSILKIPAFIIVIVIVNIPLFMGALISEKAIIRLISLFIIIVDVLSIFALPMLLGKDTYDSNTPVISHETDPEEIEKLREEHSAYYKELGEDSNSRR